MYQFLKCFFSTLALSILLCHCSEGQNKAKPEKLTKNEESTIRTILAKRHPLPYPPEVKNKLDQIRYKSNQRKEGLIHMLMQERSVILYKIEQLGKVDTFPISKFQEYKILQKDLFVYDETIAAAVADECGEKNNCQDVELYDGTLGVSKDFVEKYSSQTGKLKWKSNLPALLIPLGIAPGNVNDTSWGTGALITDEYFITAGHCFETKILSPVLPNKNGSTLPSNSLAKLMEVTFNYQISKQSKKIEKTETFEIDSLMEFEWGGFDYAIVRLKRNKDGKLPGQIFGHLDVSKQAITEKEILCVIQHPNGEYKKVEAGPAFVIDGPFLGYNDIDTYNLSSGSPVLSMSKKALIGVHIRGGCNERMSDYNRAVPVRRLVAASTILKSIAK